MIAIIAVKGPKYLNAKIVTILMVIVKNVMDQEYLKKIYSETECKELEEHDEDKFKPKRINYPVHGDKVMRLYHVTDQKNLLMSVMMLLQYSTDYHYHSKLN